MSYKVNNITSNPPTGSITAYLGTTDPDGWVIMDGVTRTNNSDSRYNGLYSMSIGSSGNGTTNYTPPNYKGSFLRGQGTNGTHVSNSLGISQEDAFQAHNHSISDPGHSHTTYYNYERFNSGGSSNLTGGDGQSSGSNSINSSTTGITINNTGGTETIPYNYAVNWILKL
jgi:hypothetical protein